MDEKQTVDGRDTVIEATRKYSRRVCVRPDSRGRHLMDQSTHNWDIANRKGQPSRGDALWLALSETISELSVTRLSVTRLSATETIGYKRG